MRLSSLLLVIFSSYLGTRAGRPRSQRRGRDALAPSVEGGTPYAPSVEGGTPSFPASRAGRPRSQRRGRDTLVPSVEGGTPSLPASRAGTPSLPASRAGRPRSQRRGRDALAPSVEGGTPSLPANEGGTPSLPALSIRQFRQDFFACAGRRWARREPVPGALRQWRPAMPAASALWPAYSPSGTVTGTRPPEAVRCASSNRSCGRVIGANGRPAFSAEFHQLGGRHLARRHP